MLRSQLMISLSLSRSWCHLAPSTSPDLSGLLLQAQSPLFQWTYVWIAAGALVLVLAILAFIYLLARRRGRYLGRLLRNPFFARADRFLSERTPRLWAFLHRRFTVSQWHGLALTIGIIVVFAAAYLFALISESWLQEEELYSFDQRIYAWLMQSINEPAVSFMGAVTHLGDPWVVTIIAVSLGLLLLLLGQFWQSVALALSVGAGAGVMKGLKWIFERARPTEQVTQAAGHSFPSGHSFVAVTLYGFMIFLVWRYFSRDIVRIPATIVLALLIFFIGLSRIILRVHWVSDVAGGFTVGLGWLVCSLVLTRALQTWIVPGSHRGHRE